MFGYSNGQHTTKSRFGSVNSTFAMDDVQCTGNEASLLNCPHNPVDNCGTTEGAGVICSNSGGWKLIWMQKASPSSIRRTRTRLGGGGLRPEYTLRFWALWAFERKYVVIFWVKKMWHDFTILQDLDLDMNMNMELDLDMHLHLDLDLDLTMAMDLDLTTMTTLATMVPSHWIWNWTTMTTCCIQNWNSFM